MRIIRDLDRENKKMKEEMEIIMKEKECIADKMCELELHLADMELMADAHKKKNEAMSLKNEAMRLKMKRIKKLLFKKKPACNMHLHVL